MGLKRHTVIIVPHGGAKFRKVLITNRQILAGFVTLAVLSLIGGFSTWHLFSYRSGVAELAELRAQNELLRGTNQSFEESARALQAQLSHYENRTQELAIIAGVENATAPLDERRLTADVGVGGAGNPDDFLLDLPAMANRASALAEQLQAVDERFDERRRWLSSRPATMPVKGVFTSSYGYRQDPVTGLRAFHRGIDLSATAGNEVRATADGIVARAGKQGGMGRAVFLAHGFGYSTRYAHMSEILVEPGQRVKRGDVLGLVGRSGRATGYHVHYEVHENGVTKNPLEFILDGTRRR